MYSEWTANELKWITENFRYVGKSKLLKVCTSYAWVFRSAESKMQWIKHLSSLLLWHKHFECECLLIFRHFPTFFIACFAFFFSKICPAINTKQMKFLSKYLFPLICDYFGSYLNVKFCRPQTKNYNSANVFANFILFFLSASKILIFLFQTHQETAPNRQFHIFREWKRISSSSTDLFTNATDKKKDRHNNTSDFVCR